MNPLLEKMSTIGDSPTTFTPAELAEAYRALLSTFRKCEKIDKTKLGKSQQTLLSRRIAALKVALTLIRREQDRNT